MTLHPVDVAVLAVYFAAMIGIGVAFTWLDVKSVIGGNFSSHARIAARPWPRPNW